MAECCYTRCLQERRLIKRELLKWSKTMVHIVGLERIAEELMGRRKWKLYQEVLARSYLNTNTRISAQNEKLDQNSKSVLLQETNDQTLEEQEQQVSVENYKINKKVHIFPSRDDDTKEKLESSGCHDIQKDESVTLKGPNENNISSITGKQDNNNVIEDSRKKTPIDWKPPEKCYFCVDGKLLTVNDKGDLVAESGPASSEAEFANRTSIDSESDSSDSIQDLELQNQGPLTLSTAAGIESGTQSTRKALTSHLLPTMTSLESMAAHLAAVASIQGLQTGLGPFCPNVWYNQFAQQVAAAPPPSTPSTVDNVAPCTSVSPSTKDSPSPSDVTGEQPLDLSAKPSSNASASGGDQKQIFRAKPRMSAITGRRTYTEEELHSALQDIMSGKLGTRRAAVLYGIPRSTLRNKVYKIAMEQKRETNLLHPPVLDDLADVDDDDRDLSGDDEKDEKLLTASHLGANLIAQPEDLATAVAANFRTSQSSTPTSSATTNAAAAVAAATASILQNMHQKSVTPESEDLSDMKTSTLTSQHTAHQMKPPCTPQSAASAPPPTPITQNPWLDTNVLLQSLLLSLSGMPGLIQPKTEDQNFIRELFNNLMLQQEEFLKEQAKAAVAVAAASASSSSSTSSTTADIVNNGKPNLLDPRHLMQNLSASLFLQQQQQQQQQQQHQQMQHHMQQQKQQHQQIPQHSSNFFQRHLPKTEMPDTGPPPALPSDLMEGMTDDPSIVLKIPSYKPAVVASSSSSSSSSSLSSANKNGEHISSPVPQMATTATAPVPLLSRSPQQTNNLPGISPPLIRQSSESQSPPTFSLREVIANSISRTFNQQAKEATNMMKVNAGGLASDLAEQHKRASISVIKNLGGTDITRFAAQPNLLSHTANSANNQNISAANAAAGGKGTRPKRGKYRNYDRDSLVEAVKAVQRGEMSVHRAGSYYGVPHSTLEYKVKERHLMRPRKREPKPQPLDDRLGGMSGSGSSTSSSINSKNVNIPSLSAVNSLDKIKSSSSSCIIGGSGGNSTQKSSNLKTSPPFSSASANGMKVPLFDPAMAAQYTQQFFWPHSPAAAAAAAAAASFGGLPLDFHRPTGSSPAGGTVSAAAFPQTTAENFLASQVFQRFHEESNRLNVAAIAAANNMSLSPSTGGAISKGNSGNVSSSNNNNNNNNIANSNNSNDNMSSNNNNKYSPSIGNPSLKNARELAESLYENSGGANGSSFLDGIIRKTLDRKAPDAIPHGALLDQLVRNVKTPVLNNNSGNNIGLNTSTIVGSSSAGGNSSSTNSNNNNCNENFLNEQQKMSPSTRVKRSASPVHFPVIDIKRERSSPTNTIITSTITNIPGMPSIGEMNSIMEHNISTTKDHHSSTLADQIEGSTTSRDRRHMEDVFFKVDDNGNTNRNHHLSAHLHSHLQQQEQQYEHEHYQAHSIVGSSSSSSSSGSNNNNNTRLSIGLEDLNGSNALSVSERLGQIKEEKEDIS